MVSLGESHMSATAPSISSNNSISSSDNSSASVGITGAG